MPLQRQPRSKPIITAPSRASYRPRHGAISREPNPLARRDIAEPCEPVSIVASVAEPGRVDEEICRKVIAEQSVQDHYCKIERLGTKIDHFGTARRFLLF